MSESAAILVVDDDAGARAALKDNLELDGYRVLDTARGREALAMVERHSVDLLLLELVLPDMDGIQVCRAIRARSSLPVIMLTARKSVSDRVLGLESGADDYIVKPFNYLEVAARIRVCLRRREKKLPPKPALRAGPFAFDTCARRLSVAGRPLSLTRREFDLLLLMATHADRALSRDEIRRALWPAAELYKWSRTIDVHVRNLRSKIEEHPEKPVFLRTVPGIGYMFALKH